MWSQSVLLQVESNVSNNLKEYALSGAVDAVPDNSKDHSLFEKSF